MAGFFSLQPNPDGESNLSRFASANPNLEHIGNTATYLNPSQIGGETLHSPFEEQGNVATSGARPSGNLMAMTGDQGVTGVPSGGTSAMTGARTPQRQAPSQGVSGVSGTQLSPNQIQALQTIGTVQQGINAIPNSAVASLKESIKNSATGSQYSDEQIDQFIQSLSDPDFLKTSGLLTGDQVDYEALASLRDESGNPLYDTSGLTLGVDTNLDTSWLNNFTTGTRTAPSALDKFGKGDIMSALNIGGAAVTGDPAAILASLNRAAPTVAKYITDNQAILKDVGSIAGVASGAYSLYQGIQSNNPTQIAGGVGQLLQSAGTSRIGLDVLSQLTGVSTGAIANAFSAVGGITGAFSLYQAIQSGDPVQALLSAGSIYGALSTVAPSVFTPLSTLATNALVAVAPELAASLGIAAGVAVGTEAGAVATEAAALGISSVGTAGGTIAAAAAAWALPVAVVAVILTSAISSSEEMKMRASGWWNNPIKGQLYSAATEGVQTANTILDNIDTVGIQNISTEDLASALPTIVDSLKAYYATAQGGRGPIRASDTLTGGSGMTADSGAKGLGGTEQYTANAVRAQNRLSDVIKELMQRGVTYEQLGQLPVSGNYSLQSMDMGNTPSQMLLASPNLSRYESEALGLAPSRGISPYGEYSGGGGEAGSWSQQYTRPSRETMNELLTSVLGASMLKADNPQTGDVQSELMTSMYGGPLWTAIARMGIGGPELQQQILQHFDPWVLARTTGSAPTPAPTPTRIDEPLWYTAGGAP